MKIGMIAWSFYPRAGGSVTTALGLSESLAEKGIEIHIIAPLLKRDFARREGLLLSKGVSMHWITSSWARGYTDFYSRLIFFLKITAAVRRLSPVVDIFHAHDFNISFLSAIIGTRKPIVAVFGADPLYEMFNFKKTKCADYQVFTRSRPVRFFAKIMKAFVTFVSGNKPVAVILNEYSRAVIKNYYAGPAVVIPAGIDLSLYRSDQGGGESKNETILVVARFVPWKRIDAAIAIFQKVKESRKGARIVFLGHGPLAGYFARKYKKIEGAVFIADLDYRQVAGYYRQASVLLVTSGYETFGINIIEAMACGLPIVANDLEVFHDRLSDNVNASLVSGNDTACFAEKLIRLLDDVSVRKMFIRNALDKVQGYGIGGIADRYLALYNRLLRNE